MPHGLRLVRQRPTYLRNLNGDGQQQLWSVRSSLRRRQTMRGGRLCRYGPCDSPALAHTQRGSACLADILECASNPCSHGVCHELHNGYNCECHAGWTGEHCDTGTSVLSTRLCSTCSSQRKVSSFSFVSRCRRVCHEPMCQRSVPKRRQCVHVRLSRRVHRNPLRPRLERCRVVSNRSQLSRSRPSLLHSTIHPVRWRLVILQQPAVRT